MARRMNPQRRLIAKLKAYEAQAHSLTVGYNEEPLQKGSVRSSLNPRVGLTAYAVPRDNWEGLGSKARKGKRVWAVTGSVNVEFDTRPRFDIGVTDPNSGNAPKDD